MTSHSPTLGAFALACGLACAHVDSTPPAPSPAAIANGLKDRASAAFEAKRCAESYQLWNEAYAIEPLPATAVSVATAAACLQQVDNAFTWLHTAIDNGFTAVKWLKDPDLAVLRGDPRWAKLPERIRPHAQAHAQQMNVGGGMVRITPQQAGVNPEALHRLLQRAEQSKTNGLVLLKDGKLIGDWYFGDWSRPIETQELTKSIAALAVGFLLQEHKVESLDEPLWHFFPELRQGLKAKLTVRHLLTQTSGMVPLPNFADIFRASDFVRLALAADLESDPGVRFQPNNQAANLLAGMVERASGQKIDAYLQSHLFDPLGIRDVQWVHDKGGNPHGMAGLQVHPLDLAKVGQWVLDNGVAGGKVILPAAFMEAATRKPSTSYSSDLALMWWLTWDKVTREIPAGASRALQGRNLNPEWVKAVKAVEGRALPYDEFFNQLAAVSDKEALLNELERAGSPLRHNASGLRSIEARGDRGQYLIVFPAHNLVAVRLSDADEDGDLPEFSALVANLTTKN